MRPLRLELRGFTAFRDAAEIDFTALDVFAISGPTGSGKSSLLDAMTYALYGRVERVGEGVKQLISQGQPRMAVTLEFEVDHDRYRVTRSTPSGRGPTKILLERLADGEWSQAGDGADRVRDAERMLAVAIGMTYDGFTRSVLLPQGKFAEFLVGDAKKRRDILTELLGLSLFRRMAERAGSIGKEAAVRADTMSGMLDRDYADATPEALKAAKTALKEAEKRERALGAAAEDVLEILGRWQASERAAQELQACATEAARAAEDTRAVAAELGDLAHRAEEITLQVASTKATWKAAVEAVEAARADLQRADATLGASVALTEARLLAHRVAEAATLKKKKEAELAESTKAGTALASAADSAAATLAAAGENLAARQADLALSEAVLEKARHTDLVAAVSAGLKAGDPCPVCGLPLEKAPRRTAAGAFDKATKAAADGHARVEAAREGETAAARALDAARREGEANAEQVHRLSGEIQEVDQTIVEGITTLRQILGTTPAEEAGAEIDRRLAELERLDRAERDAATAAAEAERDAARAEQERDKLAALVERLGDRLATDRTPLFERASRATDGRVTVPSVAPPPRRPAVTQLAQYAEELAETLGMFAEDLTRQADQQGSLEARLLEEGTKKVGDLIEPAGSIEQLAASVNAACRSATATVATAAKEAKDLTARLERRKGLVEEVRTLESRASLFRALALELRADRLIAFLQAEALQVLAAAGSDRLASLSDARYRLVYRDDEFLVVDTWNGDEERSVRTLSGGETFLASLGLALGLADQVRSLSVTDRARLDSLFLDEGFGTLDPESLRTVVDAIEQLAGDGRLVGVITHVQDLAEQFPRIEVRKERNGSRLEFVA
jgi:exonuclease SbcC